MLPAWSLLALCAAPKQCAFRLIHKGPGPRAPAARTSLVAACPI